MFTLASTQTSFGVRLSAPKDVCGEAVFTPYRVAFLANTSCVLNGCALGPHFSKGPVTFRARREMLKLKPGILAQLMTHKPVNFASLTVSFRVSFSKLFKL